MLFKLVDNMHSIWDENFFLDRAQALVQKALDEHANYNTAELSRSRPVEKLAATRRRLGEQVACVHAQHAHDVYKLRRKVKRRVADYQR